MSGFFLKHGVLVIDYIQRIIRNIVRPHRSNSVAYCYRWSSVVCLLLTFVSHEKVGEPIEMLFGG